MILSNIYHRPAQPDTAPRVALRSPSVGQSYVHVLSGVVRTVHAKWTDSITIARHDPGSKWCVREYDLDKMVIVVGAAPATKSKVIKRPVGQVEMF